MPGILSHLSFVFCLGVGALIYHFPISALGALVFKNETYSHIVLIPVVSLFLLLTQGSTILAVAERRPIIGCAVCAAGLLLYGIATGFWNPGDEIRSLRGSDRIFLPKIDGNTREKMYSGWKEIVARVISNHTNT